MKINGTSNNSFQNKVLIDTFIEQISALQTDVGNLQIADDNLSQALATKANTADINTAVNTGTLTSTNGNIKTLRVQGTGSSATIQNATIGTASIGTETVTQSNITNLEVMDVDAGTVRTGTLTVENDAAISGDMTVQDVSAKDITSASVNTLNVTTAEADVNKLEARNAEITNKLTVNDLEVSGNFTGVSNIETESVNAEDITADTADIETLDVENIRSWVTQVMNQDQILNPPTPALGNVDTYTIELPRFTGVFLLSWEDADVVWSAAVIGNGKSYGISWGSRTDQNFITDLFQYNGKLYIRINSNGKLKYAYSTTKELDQIVIYRNMDGWTSDKSLEELCDELSHIKNVYSAGTVWLGHVTIPRLDGSSASSGSLAFKGSCKFAELPAFSDTEAGDVWNITDEAYTDGRFVEGAGKPINAGDDVVAVIEDLGQREVIPIAEDTFGNFSCEILCKTADGNFIVARHNEYGGDEGIYVGKGENWTKCVYVNEGETSDLVVYSYIWCLSNGNLVTDYFDYSTDNGLTWHSATLMAEYDDVSQAQVVESKGRVFYQSIHDSLYSDDFGLTWYPVDYESFYYDKYKILLDDGSLLIQHSNEDDEGNDWWYKSSDKGETWTPIAKVDWDVSYGISNNNWVNINGTLFMSDSDYSNYEGNIVRSTDSGETWSIVLEAEGDHYSGDAVWYGGIRTDGRVLFVNKAVQQGDSETLISYDNGNTFETYLLDSDYAPAGEILTYLEGHTFGTDNGLFYYKETSGTRIKWDKFSAGVNYENFEAENITATESLKSEGTLEVDGVSKFNNNITQTGNYTATGNLNRTGNETIIGTVVIGDLD